MSNRFKIEGRRGKPFKNQTAMLTHYARVHMTPILVKRDGGVCAIKGYRHTCSEDLVLDHRPVKRGTHISFLDPTNLTTVCGNANYRAEQDAFISKKICDVILVREGQERYDYLDELTHSKSNKIKKWSAQECEEWIERCAKHFKTHKNGTPKCS